jgi:hypothetical protein
MDMVTWCKDKEIVEEIYLDDDANYHYGKGSTDGAGCAHGKDSRCKRREERI